MKHNLFIPFITTTLTLVFVIFHHNGGALNEPSSLSTESIAFGTLLKMVSLAFFGGFFVLVWLRILR